MTRNNLDRTITTESFEYGNHTIKIKVGIEHARRSSSIYDIMNSGSPSETYYRYITTKARHPDGGTEVKNRSHVRLTAAHGRKTITLPFVGEVTILPPKTGPSVEDHIEYTTRPVFEELDELYQFTDRDVTVDVDVGIERVEHEISWIDVEDEMERLSREIDEITGVAE